MQTILAKKSNKVQNRLNELVKKPLEPKDYCERWVSKLWGIQPNEWGYRGVCIKEIYRVTGISVNTINTWGATFDGCPDHVRHALRQADIINEIREKVALPPELFKDEEK